MGFELLPPDQAQGRLLEISADSDRKETVLPQIRPSKSAVAAKNKTPIIETIKKNPLARALRIDKLTLAALEATISLYRDEAKAVRRIPTLRMLTMGINEIEQKASKLMENLKKIDPSRLQINLIELSSKAGGGALPLLSLPSKCLRIKVDGLSANNLEINMRKNSPPITQRQTL